MRDGPKLIEQTLPAVFTAAPTILLKFPFSHMSF